MTQSYSIFGLIESEEEKADGLEKLFIRAGPFQGIEGLFFFHLAYVQYMFYNMYLIKPLTGLTGRWTNESNVVNSIAK